MADSGFTRLSINDFYQPKEGVPGRERYLADLQKYVDTENEREFLLYLQGIPATDAEKKRELAAFYRETRTFSREQREQGYNDLLGRTRNRRQIG